MCGICGILDTGGGRVRAEDVARMTGAIVHRGPDGAGSYVNGSVGLGHRRLSIIDLDGGAQPIQNETGSIQVVFNGEIYNFIELREELESCGHVFATRSDTEVIVHGYEQWGVDCVTRFNGMFAFALWDEDRAELVLARDHLGIKPLYYTTAGGRFLFASEIKALLTQAEVSRQVDLASLSKLFSLRYVPSPDTLFAGIKKVSPACWVRVGKSGFRSQRYWTSEPEVRYSRLDDGVVERYRDLLEDAVRLQMRSDVPVGLFLSSGIDSGALLALMSKHAGRAVRTFTLGFEGGERTNETAGARELSQLFGSDHTEWIIGPGDYVRYYERYLFDLEEPVGNETAAAFYFVALMTSKSVKVALTGQGADEPWAGYHRHLGMRLSSLADQLGLTGPAQMLIHAVEKWSGSERLIRGFWSLSERDMLRRLVRIYSFYSPAMKTQLFQPWLKEQVSPTGDEARDALEELHGIVKGADPLTQILFLDTRTNLPDDLLMVGDKTAMANSLEARVPFLDYRLIEFIESLAPTLKLRRTQGKYMHKVAVEKWLPSSIVYRKKKGFDNPIQDWLRGPMYEYLKSNLLAGDAGVRQYFDGRYIQSLIADHQAGRRDNLRHLYLLLSFELWHRQFIQARTPVAA